MRLLTLALLVTGLGCATDSRFRQQHVQLSKTCGLLLVEDRRTHLCLASYRCWGATGGALVVVPPEVCTP
jgi:hypothetical protein